MQATILHPGAFPVTPLSIRFVVSAVLAALVAAGSALAFQYRGEIFKEIYERQQHSVGRLPPDPMPPAVRLAVTGVNLIPMASATVLERYTVLVDNGLVTDIGPTGQVAVPEGYRVIDGRNRWMMPGLADMHVHFDNSALAFRQFLVNGVTSIRNMNGSPEILAWARAVRDGRILGPRIYSTGPILNGKATIDGTEVVTTAAEAKRGVRRQLEAGYRAIKPYTHLSRETYSAAMEEAGRLGMCAVGHVPYAVGIEGVIDAGQDEIAHIHKTSAIPVPLPVSSRPADGLTHPTWIDGNGKSERSPGGSRGCSGCPPKSRPARFQVVMTQVNPAGNSSLNNRPLDRCHALRTPSRGSLTVANSKNPLLQEASMKATRKIITASPIRRGIASSALGVLLLALPGLGLSQTYEGAEFCAECHEAKYNDWKTSGHPYKLTKAEEARHRALPLPAGYTWDDISYVIGGYRWKSRYMDKDGYIITSVIDPEEGPVDGHNQYNLQAGTWSDYHAGESKLPYDCGACHTTGWVADTDAATDGTLADNQDGLPGIYGTFEFGGVQCEACHGPGYSSMQTNTSSALCGTCHIRGTPDSIPAKGGFIQHHEQFNEFLASPHADALSCVSCHDPHKKAEFSIKKQCEDCHAEEAESFAAHSMADYGVECEDCHMPFATKSATAMGPHQGDVKTHLFAINTDPAGRMFTADGAFVKLDGAGKAAATLDFVCQRCHDTADINELARFAKNFHHQTLEDIGLNPGLTGTWWNAERAGEGFLLEFANAGQNLVLFASFYSYDPMGNQMWLVAVGDAGSGTSVDVNVYFNSGRKWGPDYNPNDGSEVLWGTGTFTFPTCTSGSVSLSPNQEMKGMGYTDLSYDITRDLLTSGIQCPTFVNNAQ